MMLVMAETIFDYLPEQDRIEGDNAFEDLIEDWGLRDMTLEDAFKIGFARGKATFSMWPKDKSPNGSFTGSDAAGGRSGGSDR
jgi:hypothetical protein